MGAAAPPSSAAIVKLTLPARSSDATSRCFMAFMVVARRVVLMLSLGESPVRWVDEW